MGLYMLIPITVDSPRILCMVLTLPSTWDNKTRAVHNTWGRRCDKTFYFYSPGPAPPSHIPPEYMVPLDFPEGRGTNLTLKVKAAFKWALTNHHTDIDWFLKADDDSYVIVENLKAYLKRFPPHRPHYVGKSSDKRSAREAFASGGPGYVLNKFAVKLMLHGEGQHPDACKPHLIEDPDVGECLRSFGVYVHDTIDNHGRQRQHHVDPILVLKDMEKDNKMVNYSSKIYWMQRNDFTFGTKYVSSNSNNIINY